MSANLTLLTTLLAIVVLFVLLAPPLKLEPLEVISPVIIPIVLEVCKVSAVLAFPFKVAEIVPALKFPEASLATTVEPVLVAVALDVIVGFPLTPSPFDTDSPVPLTATLLVLTLPSEVLTTIPLVVKLAIAVKSESKGCLLFN
jgi:hypothetical protein